MAQATGSNAGSDRPAGPWATTRLYVVQGQRVVWMKTQDRRPGPLRSFTAKPAAYGVWKTERAQFADDCRRDPAKLERRLERMHDAEPSVAWYVSEQLRKDGFIDAE